MDGSSDEDMSSLTAVEQKKALEEKSKSAKAELQELKKKRGNWAVASKVLTKANIQQKDILCIVSRAACTHHSEEARELLTAGQIQAHSVKAVTGQGWAQELVLWLLQYGFLSTPKNCFCSGRGICHPKRIFCFLFVNQLQYQGRMCKRHLLQ